MKVERKTVFKFKWFDYECIKLRKISFKLLNLFRQNSFSLTKQLYIEANTKFKKLCISKKQQYTKSLAIRLGNNKNSKDWGAAIRDIKNINFRISNQILVSTFKEHFKCLLEPITLRKLTSYVKTKLSIKNFNSVS